MDPAEKKHVDEFWAGEDVVLPNLPSQDKATDMVNHPPHYTAGKVECIDAIESAIAGLNGHEGYCTGNAIKYLWRWKHKCGKEDLKKAAWYLNRLVAYTESKNAN